MKRKEVNMPAGKPRTNAQRWAKHQRLYGNKKIPKVKQGRNKR